MKKIVTLGEIMLRLSPSQYKNIEQADTFDIIYGGGEANVAISLAKLGLHSSFVSKVPNNPLGISAVQHLNRYGVSTDNILYGGERLGIYFMEKGFSIRPSKVIYDRKGSSFIRSTLDEYDFNAIFEGADWFHISGITPALNKELFLITKAALTTAKEKGITSSLDLNYRSALWSFDDARIKLSELIDYVDVCIGIEPLQLLDEEGIDIKDNMAKNPTVEDYRYIIKLLQERYPIKYLAMTMRETLSVHRNRLSAVLSDGKNFYHSEGVEVEIVDRVGTGDAFSSGLIYSLIHNDELQHAIDFATTSFALKHTIEGDANLLQLSDIEQYMNNKGSLSIKR